MPLSSKKQYLQLRAPAEHAYGQLSPYCMQPMVLWPERGNFSNFFFLVPFISLFFFLSVSHVEYIALSLDAQAVLALPNQPEQWLLCQSVWIHMNTPHPSLPSSITKHVTIFLFFVHQKSSLWAGLSAASAKSLAKALLTTGGGSRAQWF